MLKKIGLGLLIAFLAFITFVALQPDELHVQRSASIQAPPAKVFALINDFKNWPVWSPWEQLDPDMKKTYSDPSSGQGATYRWEGNDDVGIGQMTMVSVSPHSHFKMTLEFMEPFQSVSTVDFYLKDQGEATEVTWSMRGENGFIEKVFDILFDMEAMIGKDYEKGLDNLKKAVETP